MGRERSQFVLDGIAMVHGSYFFLSGLWPIVSLSSFLHVTGPKTDVWLVRTVAVLVIVSGGVLFAAGVRKRVSAEVIALALGNSFALAGVDVIYVTVGRIPPIYLLDAVAEAILIVAWLVGIWMLRDRLA